MYLLIYELTNILQQTNFFFILYPGNTFKKKMQGSVITLMISPQIEQESVNVYLPKLDLCCQSE